MERRRSRSYLGYLTNPLELLRTKKVLHVNPTATYKRVEPPATKISICEYDLANASFATTENILDTFKYLESPQNAWINLDGLRKDDVEKIGARYGVHSLILEDILSEGQRPKTDEIGGQIFCLLYMLYFNEKTESVETEQISMVLGDRFVISFQEDASRDVFNGLREKLKMPNSKVRQSDTDYLFYTLIDSIVDHYYLVMEKLGDKIEQLEEDIIRSADKRALARINLLRKEMIVLKRNITPVRDLVNGILRSENPLIQERTVKYFKDVYDHIVQATDLAENYRDMMMNLQDLYLNNVNLKLNEVMKVMAIVTCLLAPATVIGGIFGMNFERLPLLHNQWGFYISVGIMLLIPLWMIIIFKRRGWF